MADAGRVTIDIGSSLIHAAEIGPAVRLAAFGATDGQRRLLAMAEAASTYAAPHFDPRVGFEDARGELASKLGVLADGEQVEPAVITGGALGNPIKASVISNLHTDDELRLTDLLRANGFEIGAEMHAPNKRLIRQFDPEEIARNLLVAQSPLVVIALAKDQGWESLSLSVDVLKYAVEGRLPRYSPAIAVLHSDDPHTGLISSLADTFEVFDVSIKSQGDGVDVMAARGEIASAYQTLVLDHGASRLPLGLNVESAVPTGAALAAAARQIAVNGGISVAVLHVEPWGAVAAYSDGSQAFAETFGSDRNSAAEGHIGLLLPIEQILEWVPVVIPETAARAYFLNRAWRPWLVPETPAELLLDHAAAHLALREAVRSIGDPAPAVDLIVCTGRTLATVPRLVQAALCGINAYLPTGYCQVAVDKPGVLAMSGALLALGIEIAPEASLVHVATCVACDGIAKIGSPALAVEVKPEEGETVSRSVSFGSMDRITWDSSASAEVRAWPGSKLDVGGGRSRATALRNEIRRGEGGLIIDARGRPIGLPDDATRRRAALLQWFQSTDSYALPSPELEWGGVEY